MATQLSLSLTSMQPANRRLAYLPLAWTSGSEQSVPPPPYFANRSARLRIVSCGSSRALSPYCLRDFQHSSVVKQVELSSLTSSPVF